MQLSHLEHLWYLAVQPFGDVTGLPCPTLVKMFGSSIEIPPRPAALAVPKQVLQLALRVGKLARCQR